jgi:hypothetical protein
LGGDWGWGWGILRKRRDVHWKVLGVCLFACFVDSDSVGGFRFFLSCLGVLNSGCCSGVSWIGFLFLARRWCGTRSRELFGLVVQIWWLRPWRVYRFLSYCYLLCKSAWIKLTLYMTRVKSNIVRYLNLMWSFDIHMYV